MHIFLHMFSIFFLAPKKMHIFFGPSKKCIFFPLRCDFFEDFLKNAIFSNFFDDFLKYFLQRVGFFQ